MNLSLRARLFASHALVIASMLVILTALAAQGQRRWLIARSIDTLGRAAALAAHELMADPAATAGDWPSAAEKLGRAYGVRVTLIDSTGLVLGDTDVPGRRLAEVENHRNRPEVAAALAGHSGHAVRHSATVGRDLLYVAIPAHIAPVAVVRLAEPLSVISSLNTSLLGSSLAAAAITLLISLLLVYWLSGRQSARVRRLEVVARLVGEGRQARARERPTDELGRLGRALNQMAAELHRRLDTLEQERNEHGVILAHMRDGVALIDAEGRIRLGNHGMASLLGAPLPPLPGTPFREFARAPELDDLLDRARSAGHSVELDLRLWSPRPRLVNATATPLDGSHPAVLLVLHDLSEAEALNRVRQDFVANVSHELRTPLTSLRGYAETLLDGGIEDAEHREGFVRIIRDQAVRLESLVHDLLSLAELERPGLLLNVETFDLRELVTQQALSFRPRAERVGLRLAVESGAPLLLRADRARLEQVVANLLDNAIKYTERGSVTVTLGGDDRRVWCEVSDTGPGIPEADTNRVFERFYRVDKARSREKGGTGLGLSIVKHIVVLHGGTVSAGPGSGGGSVFRFEIPRDPQALSMFPPNG